VVLWAILAAGVALLLGLIVVFRWASGDEGVERQATKERFQAEQGLRGLRRAGKL
jgi:hypothetical protein